MTRMLCSAFLLTLLASYSFCQTETKQTILFDFDKATLNKSQKRILDSISTQLKSSNNFSVSLMGHTDNSGPERYNDLLSSKRVVTIKKYLQSINIDTSKVKIASFGERIPLVDNTSRANRALNRRVEMSITIPVISPPIVSKIIPENKPSGNKQPSPGPNCVIAPSSGSFSNGNISVEVIENTAQMEEANFTTMTVENEPLVSNVMVCARRPPGVTSCELKEPIIIKVPIGRNSNCAPRDLRYYDSEKDSATGITRWRQVPPTYTTENTDTMNYFVIKITNLCNPCKNFDCPKPDTLVKFRLAGSKFKFNNLKLIYHNTNALLTATKYQKKIWAVKSLRQATEDPVVKLKATNKKGKQYIFETTLSAIPKNKKGICLIDKDKLQEMEL